MHAYNCAVYPSSARLTHTTLTTNTGAVELAHNGHSCFSSCVEEGTTTYDTAIFDWNMNTTNKDKYEVVVGFSPFFSSGECDGFYATSNFRYLNPTHAVRDVK